MKSPVDWSDAVNKFGKPEINKLKKITVYRRGRQRSDEQVKQLFFYWWHGRKWPKGLSDDMILYYRKNYVLAEGRAHEKYQTWRKEYREKFGKPENKLHIVRA